MRVRQIDVARSAGVTRAVVSHVLNGGSGSVRVSEETAQRVRDAAQQLRYTPNASARNLKRSKTDQIGILHGDGCPRLRLSKGSRYFAYLMDGIIDGAFDNGYTVCLCPMLFSPTPEDSMADGRFDGLIWYSTFPSESNIERLRHCSAPIVLIHSHAADFDNRFPTVICDNEQGIRLGLEHLAELGHRKVGFAYMSSTVFGEADLRLRAFMKVGVEMGLEVFPIDFAEESSLLDYPFSETKPTALIAENEQLASDLMVMLTAKGWKIPGDISVVGFDSTDYCDLQEPKLTSITQPIMSLGYRAAEVLAQLISGHTPSPFETILPCGLDVRGSTGPPR